MLRAHRESKVNGHHLPVVARKLTPEQHAEGIRAAWNKSIDAIFETGDRIERMFAECRHGEIKRLIAAEKVPFGYETCRRFRQIASNKFLRELHSHGSVLPASWKTIWLLSCIPDDDLRKYHRQGWIHTELEQRDIEVVREIIRKRNKKNLGEDKQPDPEAEESKQTRTRFYAYFRKLRPKQKLRELSELQAMLADESLTFDQTIAAALQIARYRSADSQAAIKDELRAMEKAA